MGAKPRKKPVSTIPMPDWGKPVKMRTVECPITVDYDPLQMTERQALETVVAMLDYAGTMEEWKANELYIIVHGPDDGR